jgi:hypothetical protein
MIKYDKIIQAFKILGMYKIDKNSKIIYLFKFKKNLNKIIMILI